MASTSEELNLAATTLQKVARGRRSRHQPDAKPATKTAAAAQVEKSHLLSSGPSPSNQQAKPNVKGASNASLFSFMEEKKGEQKAEATKEEPAGDRQKGMLIGGAQGSGTSGDASVAGFFSTWTTGASAAPTPGQPTAPPHQMMEGEVQPEDVAPTMGFLHWMVDLQNQLVALWERRDAEERKRFKQEQDAKFAKHKQELHQKTAVQFGNAQRKVELLHEENLRRGQVVKRDTESIRQAVAAEREQWIQHGHALTAVHGREQQERTKHAVAELVAEKAEQGRRVRIEGQQHGKDIYVQRSKDLGVKREHVQELKKLSSGKVEESMTYTYNSKREAVREVQRIEDKWKRLSMSQRDTFRAHAGENHKKNDDIKEHARQAHSDLVRSNNQIARSERELKKAHSGQIVEKRTAMTSAKRGMRDVIFNARFVPPDKTKVMRDAKRDPSPEKLELAAKHLGLIDAPPPRVTALPSSPYRLRKASAGPSPKSK